MEYCVYFTTYNGDKMPPYYIGSTSVKKLENGYHGSVSSKKYKAIWNKELKEHPELFKSEILRRHKTRKDALANEWIIQKAYDVVRDPDFINLATATVNGFFGRDVSGKNNPMFGRSLTIEQRQKFSGKNHGMYGKNLYLMWIEKYGKEQADILVEQNKQKHRITSRGSNNAMFNKPRTIEQKIHQSDTLCGRRGMIKNGIQKRIKPENFEEMLNAGWIFIRSKQVKKPRKKNFILP